MNYPLLKSELEQSRYEGLSTPDVLAKINEETIEYFVEVATPEMTNFMMNTGIYAKLLSVYRDHPVKQVRVVAESALDLAQSQIPFVNVQNPSIQMLLPALVQGQVWTQDEADSLINFARRFQSRAQELLGEKVTEANINTARNLDNIAALRALEELLNSAHGDVLGVVQGVRAALEAGDLVDVPDAAAVVARFTQTMETT